MSDIAGWIIIALVAFVVWSLLFEFVIRPFVVIILCAFVDSLAVNRCLDKVKVASTAVVIAGVTYDALNWFIPRS